MRQQGNLNLGQAEWSNPHIEWKIICEALKVKHNMIVKLHVMEIHEQATDDVEVHEQQVDRVVGSKSVDFSTEDYEAVNIVHLVNYKNHFVPLLDSKKAQKEKLLIQFSEYSGNNSFKFSLRI